MLQYLIKFSLSLAVLYVFYRAVLRPLTFYQWNRFYLLGYSLLSFIIPFVDISGWMSESAGEDNRYISIIPSVSRYTFITEKQHPSFFQQLTPANWILLVFLAGSLFMLVRLLLQYISLRRLRANSQLLTGQDQVQLYETSENITPFSFGNAIYINPARHTEEELQRIIQHEFVHVRQKHSFDLLTGELLCIINWFNPFAWFIRHAIRQNLEFIADRQVLQNGIAKKDYQYLLLKVIGVPQYALASHFNFSNLKKRIAMMNKMKTARLHLTKFLFVLPLLAVLLVSFRAYHSDKDKTAMVAGSAVSPQQLRHASTTPQLPLLKAATTENRHAVVTDTLPAPPPPPPAAVNKKGYVLTIADNNGECVVLVKDQQRKIIKAVTLEEWNKNKKENEARYGTIPPAPAPAAPVAPVNNLPAIEPVAPVPPNTAVGPHTQPRVVTGGIVSLKELNILYPPLYIVDGKEMEEGYNINSLKPEDISSVSVWKDEKTINKYGEKAKYGVVEISTRHKTRLPEGILIILDGKEMPVGSDPDDYTKEDAIESMNVLQGKSATDKYGKKGGKGVIELTSRKKDDDLLKDVLLIIDGRELPAGSKLSDYVRPADIESMNVLKDNRATIKYGEKAKKGAIEIKTKNTVKPPVKNEIINMIADSIVISKQHVKITGGNMVMGENKSIAIIEGSFHFDKRADLPYVVFNGHEVKDIPSFTITKAKFSMRSLDPNQGIAKYGSKAAFGALEINSL